MTTAQEISELRKENREIKKRLLQLELSIRLIDVIQTPQYIQVHIPQTQQPQVIPFISQIVNEGKPPKDMY